MERGEKRGGTGCVRDGIDKSHITIQPSDPAVTKSCWVFVGVTQGSQRSPVILSAWAHFVVNCVPVS